MKRSLESNRLKAARLQSTNPAMMPSFYRKNAPTKKVRHSAFWPLPMRSGAAHLTSSDDVLIHVSSDFKKRSDRSNATTHRKTAASCQSIPVSQRFRFAFHITIIAAVEGRCGMPRLSSVLRVDRCDCSKMRMIYSFSDAGYPSCIFAKIELFDKESSAT